MVTTTERKPSQRHDGEPCKEEGCKGHVYFDRTCGALICDDCGTHYTLGSFSRMVGCFCGWNRNKLDPWENIDGDEE